MKYTSEELKKGYDDGFLYVKALITIQDEMCVFFYQEKTYQVTYVGDGKMTIECESSNDIKDNYITNIDDNRFEFIIAGFDISKYVIAGIDLSSQGDKTGEI